MEAPDPGLRVGVCGFGGGGLDVMAAEEAVGGRRRRRRKKSRPEAEIEFLGVRSRPNGKYGAQITDSSAQRWLGTFDTPEDAARAFDAAAVRLRGAAAETNFVQAPTSAAADEGVGLHRPSSRSRVKKKTAARQLEARAVFRGVCRTGSGKYGAHIRDSQSKGKPYKWLGSFDTAEEAARAFDAAAVRLRGAAAKTNFEQTPTSVALHRPSSQAEKKAVANRQPEAMAGVHQRRSGKYGVRITPKHSEGTAPMWLGTFDTAEDTARLCDAAAIKMSGASAVTNFEPCGQSVAKTNLKEPPVAVAADYDEGSLVELLNDFLELSTLHFRSDNIIPIAQHDDLMADLRPVEWQQVDELLKNMESTDDREALIGAAEILQKISQVGMEMVGEPNQHK